MLSEDKPQRQMQGRGMSKILRICMYVANSYVDHLKDIPGLLYHTELHIFLIVWSQRPEAI